MSLNLVPPEKKAAPERVFRSSRVPRPCCGRWRMNRRAQFRQIKATDLSRSTVQRIVDALAEEPGHRISTRSWGGPS